VAWVARHRLTNAMYQATVTALAARGFEPVNVSGYEIGGQDYYAAIFQKGGPAWEAHHDMTSAEYQTTFENLTGQGYRLVDVSGYSVGGEARYAAIWQQSASPNWVARHGLTSSQYQAEFTNLRNLGYRLVHLSGYDVGGQDYYAAIWQNPN